MVQIWQRILIAALLVTTLSTPSGARKFYSDDPISKEPKPLPVGAVVKMTIDQLYDFFYQSLRSLKFAPHPGEATNTLGEVPDSAWFTNRHGARRMSRDELQRGAGNDLRPVPPYQLVGAKTDGITPGFRMKDSRGRLYFVKPDPVSNPEMATAVEVAVSRFIYAIGYETPQNYIVNMKTDEVRFAEGATVQGLNGKPRPIKRQDLDKILKNVPYRKDGTVRVVASLAVEGRTIGPFRYEGVRTDDPNDLVQHENRRDLRGLAVMCAWLNHTDAKAQNSLDAIVTRDGVAYIQHYLIDFGSTLGSDSDMAKNARFGHDYIVPTGRDALSKMFTLGLVSPDWERANYSGVKAIGRFEAEVFHPDEWRSNYPNPAFLHALPDDEYWAAKIVMAFTDDDIRAILETAEYSDSKVVDYLTKTLAARRDKIGRVYFDKVLPLDHFAVSDGELKYEDLGVKYHFSQPRNLLVAWSRFDNEKETHSAIAGAVGFRLPPESSSASPGSYLAAKISDSANPMKTVTVYLRSQSGGFQVVGIDRTW